jgi:translation initiation factor 2B subunit (eIF-2B alpha/beta/delta family)
LPAALQERIDELRADRNHGASWMARRAVESLAELAERSTADSEALLEELHDAGRRLAAARPGVGSVAGAVGRLLGACAYERHLAPEDFRRLIQEEAHALTEGRMRAPASIAIQLRDHVAGGTVFTHSNSATVRETLNHEQPAKVLCTVSEPVGEGRDLAKELETAGIEVELVEDAEAPGRVKDATVLLIGADTVFRDGTVCNKVGTIPLARAAAEAGIPTVVAAELIKLAPVPGAQAPDLADFERELFELIPPDLITEIVTEEGPSKPEELAAIVDRVPFLREGYELVAPSGALR